MSFFPLCFLCFLFVSFVSFETPSLFLLSYWSIFRGQFFPPG